MKDFSIISATANAELDKATQGLYFFFHFLNIRWL
jgi:hypothetical protein